MQPVKSIQQWQQIRQSIAADKTLGFVATMGCLHDGHAALIKQSLQENDITVVSIFVNPTQFNDSTDYQNYPNTLQQDLTLAENLAVDYVLLPDAKAMYPNDNEIALHCTAPISQIMEGEHRPGHFDGMLTVVLKLLLLVQPTIAYFGEKDYQQYELIKQLASDYFLNCQIKSCAIVRQPSGLALSSRNQRLSADAVQKAEQFAELFHRYGELDQQQIMQQLEKLSIKVDYLQTHEQRAYIAAYVDGIRLIDNFKVGA